MNSTDIVNMTLPALSYRGLVALPNNELRLEMAKIDTHLTVKEVMETQDKLVCILIKKEFLNLGKDPESFNSIAVIGKITAVTEHLNMQRLVIKTIVRCEVLEFVSTSPIMRVSVVTKPSTSTSQTKELACVRLLVQELDQKAQNLFKGKPELISKISEGVTPELLTDIFAFNLPLDYNTKLKYLNTIDVTGRMVYLLQDIRREKVVKEIEEEIDQKVKESISENQKEFYLREKMKAIQEELGDKAKKESDIEELRKKIYDCKMPKSIEEKALNELSRYAMLSASSGESSISRTYLDFIISLPWSNKSEDCKDILKAKEQLTLNNLQNSDLSPDCEEGADNAPSDLLNDIIKVNFTETLLPLLVERKKFFRKLSVDAIMKWQSREIAQPLLKMPEKYKIVAVQMFRNLLGYMKDRKSSKEPIQHYRCKRGG